MNSQERKRKPGGGRKPKGLSKATFKISEQTDKQINELAELPEYEDRSHVVRDAVNKLHYQKIQQ
jgi:Arc/MetJ-type ribon-helix-helix transcriptional regulator